MAIEDFSFPTITNPPPRFIESPPLWRTEKQGNKVEENFCAAQSKINNQRKSFSSIESGVKREDDIEVGEEEQMDMLWEDFNEEVSRTCGSVLDSDISPERMVEFGCVEALKLSKAAAAGGKRPSIVVFMKVLRKLFLLHNSHRSPKKKAW